MDKHQALVSIIMNCYNSDTYLKEAITSVISQTYNNWEIIFWDNQSNDDSAKIVKSFDDERIKYYYAPEHTTLGEGRNLALEHVNGEYISFLDCDDWWEPNKIEITLSYFSDDKVGIVHTNGSQFFQKQNRYKEFHKSIQPSGYLFEELIGNYNISLVSAMFRKDVLNDLDYYFDTRFSMIEEFDFFVRVANTWKINYCHELLCYWRAHEASLTWSKKEKVQNEYEIFLEKILDRYPKLINHKSVKIIESKIAYHKFLNKWNSEDVADRKLIYKYLLLDKRLILIYIASFFGKKTYLNLLKFVGKNV